MKTRSMIAATKLLQVLATESRISVGTNGAIGNSRVLMYLYKVAFGIKAYIDGACGFCIPEEIGWEAFDCIRAALDRSGFAGR